MTFLYRDIINFEAFLIYKRALERPKEFGVRERGIYTDVAARGRKRSKQKKKRKKKEEEYFE